MSENENQTEELAGEVTEQVSEGATTAEAATTEVTEAVSEGVTAVQEEVQGEAVEAVEAVSQDENTTSHQDFPINKEELKSETSTTINEVRETIKNVNIKEDTEMTKGFLLNFIKNPINEVKEVANAKETFFKTAVLLATVWVVSSFAGALFSMLKYSSLRDVFSTAMFNSLLGLVKTTIAPALSIIIMAGIAMLFNKKEKHSLMTMLTTVIIARTPVIAAEVVSLLSIIGSGISTVTSPFASFCRTMSIVLLFFGLKELYNESDDNAFMKNFIVIQAAFYAVSIITRLLDIYI